MNFAATFPHLATEASTDMIGRRVRFKNPVARDGLIRCHGVFEVTGLQRIYTGETAYRVRCVEYPEGEPFTDTFGLPMRLDRADFEQIDA